MSPSLARLLHETDRIFESARNLLFPPVCPLCRADTVVPDTLCQSCWTETAFLDGPGCQYCGYPMDAGLFGADDLICENCLRFPKLWRRGRAVFRYEGAGRRLVLGLKHGDRIDRVPLLARLAIRTAGPLLQEPAVLVPIPLHWRRRLKRRANQTAELARAMARQRPGLTFAPRALLRARNTGSQDGKNRAARIENIREAFQPGPEASALSDRRVLLIDDVLTTGATLNEATRSCLALGATSVDVIVLALVVHDRRPYIGAEQEDGDETS